MDIYRPKICVCTDSRGTTLGPTTTWCRIVWLDNGYKYDVDFTKHLCGAFTTMWDHVAELKKKNKIFDIGIIQLGYHDYVVPWTMTVWRSIGLSEEEMNCSLTKFPDQNIANHEFKNCYHYRNDAVMESLFLEARKYCKKLLFVGLPYNRTAYVEKTKMMNEVFSKFCDESIFLPMDDTFPAKYTLDGIHYKDEYHQILANLIMEKIDAMK